MRRANGTGCVRKLQGKRRKKYQAIITMRVNNNYKQIHLGTFKTRKEAQQYLEYYVNSNANANEKDIKFKDVYDDWSVKHYKNIRENTVKEYISMYKKCEILHEMDMRDIKYNEVQNVIDSMPKSSRQIGKTFLKMIFDYAIKNDYIEKNYAQYAQCEKYKKKVKKIFTVNEIEKLEKDSTNCGKILKILLYTGMRISEVLNLEENDIDIINKKITIHEAKTVAGTRCVPVHDNIIHCLDFKKCSYEVIHAYIKKNYNHTCHDCRHTFASRCKQLKLDSYITKLILGHSVNDITLKVYTHTGFKEIKKEFKKFNYDI